MPHELRRRVNEIYGHLAQLLMILADADVARQCSKILFSLRGVSRQSWPISRRHQRDNQP